MKDARSSLTLPSPVSEFTLTFDRLGVLDIHMPPDCTPADLSMLVAVKNAVDAAVGKLPT